MRLSVKNIIYVARRSFPSLRVFALRVCLLAAVSVLLWSCSTTSGIPKGDQLFIGLTKIDYQDYEKSDHYETTREEVEASLATAPTAPCSAVRIIARRFLTACGYGTPFQAQRTR